VGLFSSKDEGKKQNSLKDLMEAFSCPGRPVSPAEFRTFWNSCSDDEKEYYKYAQLG
jgi:hypothetical protein